MHLIGLIVRLFFEFLQLKENIKLESNQKLKRILIKNFDNKKIHQEILSKIIF